MYVFPRIKNNVLCNPIKVGNVFFKKLMDDNFGRSIAWQITTHPVTLSLTFSVKYQPNFLSHSGNGPSVIDMLAGTWMLTWCSVLVPMFTDCAGRV